MEIPIEKMCGYCKHFETPPKCKLDGEETEITFSCSQHEVLDEVSE
jgi:hypothetical protein